MPGSRYFGTAGHHARFLDPAAAPLPHVILSEFLWVKPTFAANDGLNHVLFQARITGPPLRTHTLVKASDNTLRWNWANGATVRELVRALGLYPWTVNQWMNFFMYWASPGGTSTLVINGLDQGAGLVDDGAGRWDTTGADFVIGESTVGTNPAAAYFAHFAVWDVQIFGREIFSLAGEPTVAKVSPGLNPKHLRPSRVVKYLSLAGAGSNEPDFSVLRQTMTITGGSVGPNGPPVKKQAFQQEASL